MSDSLLAVEMVINFVFTVLGSIWSLVTSSWILTAYLIMAIISAVLLVVIPSGNKDDN